jgi:hypothetical protein
LCRHCAAENKHAEQQLDFIEAAEAQTPNQQQRLIDVDHRDAAVLD